MAIKRPNSAVAARKNRGGSGATMMNNYSRGGNTDLSRTRPKKMLQDKVIFLMNYAKLIYFI